MSIGGAIKIYRVPTHLTSQFNSPLVFAFDGLLLDNLQGLL